MKPVARTNLVDYPTYEDIRADFRRQAMAVKAWLIQHEIVPMPARQTQQKSASNSANPAAAAGFTRLF